MRRGKNKRIIVIIRISNKAAVQLSYYNLSCRSSLSENILKVKQLIQYIRIFLSGSTLQPKILLQLKH